MTVTEPEVNWLVIIPTLVLPVLGLAFGITSVRLKVE